MKKEEERGGMVFPSSSSVPFRSAKKEGNRWFCIAAAVGGARQFQRYRPHFDDRPPPLRRLRRHPGSKIAPRDAVAPICPGMCLLPPSLPPISFRRQMPKKRRRRRREECGPTSLLGAMPLFCFVLFLRWRLCLTVVAAAA